MCSFLTVAGPRRTHTCFPLSRPVCTLMDINRTQAEHRIVFHYTIIILKSLTIIKSNVEDYLYIPYLIFILSSFSIIGFPITNIHTAAVIP